MVPEQMINDALLDALKRWLNVRGHVVRNGTPVADLCMTAFNVQVRTLPVRRWEVLRSTHLLTGHPSYQKHHDGVEMIADKAERGETLYAHHARELTKANEHDPLLFDWGIYHLHLGTKPAAKDSRFVERTGDVMCVYPAGKHLIFVDIVRHDRWEDVRLVEILHREFPWAIGPHRMNTIVGLEPPVSTDDRKLLRRKGIMTCVEVDGAVYMAAGGGYTADKASAKAWMGVRVLGKLLHSDHVWSQILSVNDSAPDTEPSRVTINLDDRLSPSVVVRWASEDVEVAASLR